MKRRMIQVLGKICPFRATGKCTDIGPIPWGDGIVDVQDLIVLTEHLFEEYPPAEPVE